MFEKRKLENVNKKINEIDEEISKKQQRAESNLHELDTLTEKYNELQDYKEDINDVIDISKRFGRRKDLQEAIKLRMMLNVADFFGKRKINGITKKTEREGKNIERLERKRNKLNEKKTRLENKLNKK